MIKCGIIKSELSETRRNMNEKLEEEERYEMVN
jgi:hypothetical protein